MTCIKLYTNYKVFSPATITCIKLYTNVNKWPNGEVRFTQLPTDNGSAGLMEEDRKVLYVCVCKYYRFASQTQHYCLRLGEGGYTCQFELVC